MRAKPIWLVILPILLTGVELAHALGNALGGASRGEVFADAASGRTLLPLVAAALAAVLAAALVARVGGLWSSRSRNAVLALPFALLPPGAFVLLELVEATGGDHAPLRASAVGLALQLPFALVGYALARLLLRVADELRRLLVGAVPQLTPESLGTTARIEEVRRATRILASNPGRAPPAANAARA